MANERIQAGYEVFGSDADTPFGAVRQVSPHGRPELVVYVENAGDFTVALSAIKAVHAQKVVVNCDKLAHRLRKAIGHAVTLRIQTSDAPSRPPLPDNA